MFLHTPAREARRKEIRVSYTRNPYNPLHLLYIPARGVLGNPDIPETSTRSEAEIQGNPQIPETSTRSEVEILENAVKSSEILGNPRNHRTSWRSLGEAEIPRKSSKPSKSSESSEIIEIP